MCLQKQRRAFARSREGSADLYVLYINGVLFPGSGPSALPQERCRQKKAGFTEKTVRKCKEERHIVNKCRKNDWLPPSLTPFSAGKRRRGRKAAEEEQLYIRYGKGGKND